MRSASPCHPTTPSGLPPPLLEKLARHFGHDNPNASEDELEAFLKEKAKEFREMQQRLAQMAKAESRISELLTAANAALGEGDFRGADHLLEEAERVQLRSATIATLEKQAKLRIERGNAALISGNITAASNHFERSARYFSGIDVTLEANNRHECSKLLRYYGYRYESPEALYAARDALQQNLQIWDEDTKHLKSLTVLPQRYLRVNTRISGQKFKRS
jgi:hypothetical protein